MKNIVLKKRFTNNLKPFIGMALIAGCAGAGDQANLGKEPAAGNVGANDTTVTRIDSLLSLLQERKNQPNAVADKAQQPEANQLLNQLDQLIEKIEEKDDEKRVSEEEVEDSVDCAICLDSIKSDEKKFSAGNCKHEFHQECINKWAGVSSGGNKVVDSDLWGDTYQVSCPLCRSTSLRVTIPEDEASTNEDLSTADKLIKEKMRRYRKKRQKEVVNPFDHLKLPTIVFDPKTGSFTKKE